MIRLVYLGIAFCLTTSTLLAQTDLRPDTHQSPWHRLVRQDGPAVWWSFDGPRPFEGVQVTTGKPVVPAASPNVAGGEPGVLGTDSPLFRSDNQAALFNGQNSVLKFADPGQESVFDFDKGDAITIEAWVRVNTPKSGYTHILAKGRTNNKGFPSGNQNYALRLEQKGEQAVLSFLFRTREGKVKSDSDFHRWASTTGFTYGPKWHHVAFTYQLGVKDSARGYVDGRPVKGKWELNGPTDKAPVVDDDEVWIGSSLGVNPGSTFHGKIDELVLYRKALSPERIALRGIGLVRPEPPPLPEASPPRDRVLVEVIEGVVDSPRWDPKTRQPSEHYFEPAFAFFQMPQRYNNRGVRVDRSNPLVLRARSLLTLPKGEYRFLLRTLRFGRLFVDGKLVVETPPRGHRGDGHGAMFDLESKLAPGTRALYPGAEERMASLTLDGKQHEFALEIHVGGQGRRRELGETSLSIATKAGPFQLLSPENKVVVPLTDAGWEAYERKRRDEYTWIDQQRRRHANRFEDRYWDQRHATARRAVEAAPAVKLPAASADAGTEVDRLLLADGKGNLGPLIDDWAFLRRVSLDVIGTPPSPEMITTFFKDQKSGNRSRFIDRLLADPGWADNWVGYWQDVLAENPNVVNPTLNNTGPFRWWIYESFLDNKSFDRFATELVLMEGSEYFGGPRGFSMATQNDAPFAAKAHIAGQAFLAIQMKCARCHDAPYHDLGQKDLFSLAAMLKRSPQGVPKTSSLPATGTNSDLITITLKPGEQVPPVWPFTELLNAEIPDGFLRTSKDSRDELAARITSPYNERFTHVIVNRLWRRYFGQGLIEPVDDWEHAEPEQSDLLRWLGQELVRSGYDLKHVARVILNSFAYQQVVREAGKGMNGQPARRRMRAEQLVDSLLAVSGKQFRAGDMNIDVDGSRAFKSSLNLGIPRRAWMFSSLSNERDRPSLSLPFAQPFVTTLETFGWRSSRQNPISVRDEESTVLQPAILANGILGRRFTRLSDDSAFTKLAIEDRPAGEMVDRVFERVLTRQPTADEREVFVGLLSDGFERRVDKAYLNSPPQKLPGARTGVGWSNHLQPAANELQVATQEVVRLGDPPTKKLRADWRERFEDMLWSLMNSPEFLFVP